MSTLLGHELSDCLVAEISKNQFEGCDDDGDASKEETKTGLRNQNLVQNLGTMLFVSFDLHAKQHVPERNIVDQFVFFDAMNVETCSESTVKRII